MNSFNSICDLVLIILGVYLGVLLMRAKNTGSVHDVLLWDRTKPFDQCRDKEGYIRYIFPRGMICAILIFGAGVVGMILDHMHISAWTGYLIILCITMFTIIFYVYIMKKAMKTYY